MKKIYLFTILVLLIISACNIPRQEQPQIDVVASQVAKILTDTATVQPNPTDTQEIPTNTQLPPTEEPTLTRTSLPTATNTITPSPTSDISDPIIKLNNPTWTEEFNKTTGLWNYNDDWCSFEVANDYLNIKSKTTPYWNSWYLTSPRIKNFYLEMVFDMPSCSGGDRIGLAFRGPDNSQFYFMGITCDGRWAFEKYAENNQIINIIPYTSSAELTSTNQFNRAGVWAENNSFEFYINGKKVGQAQDVSFQDAGAIGFVTRMIETYGFTTRIDKLSYWLLP